MNKIFVSFVSFMYNKVFKNLDPAELVARRLFKNIDTISVIVLNSLDVITGILEHIIERLKIYLVKIEELLAQAKSVKTAVSNDVMVNRTNTTNELLELSSKLVEFKNGKKFRREDTVALLDETMAIILGTAERLQTNEI